MNEWMQLAPSETKLGNIADIAQTARKKGIENESESFKLNVMKTVERLAAQSIGPDGQFNQDTFYKLAAQTPAGLSAVKAASEILYPAMKARTGAKEFAKTLTPEGGVSAPAVAASAIANPDVSPEIFQAGQNAITGLAKAATDISTQRMTREGMGVTPEGTKAETLTGMGQIKPASTGAGGTMWRSEYEPENVAKLSKGDRTALAAGLKVGANATDAEIAAAMRKRQSNKVHALPGAFNPLDVGETMKARKIIETTGDKAAQDEIQAAIDEGYKNKGANLGQTSTKMEQGSKESSERARQTYARSLGLNPDNLGPKYSTEAVDAGKELEGRGESYRALVAQSKEIANNMDELSKPKNKGQLEQESASLMRLVNNVAKGSSTEGSMATSLQESGVPKSLLDSHSPVDAFKIYITTMDKEARKELVKKLPDIIYRNVLGPDYAALGGDEKAWKVKLSAKKVAKPGNKPSGNTGTPKVGDVNAKGEVWTGKRWK